MLYNWTVETDMYSVLVSLGMGRVWSPIVYLDLKRKKYLYKAKYLKPYKTRVKHT